MLLFCRNPFGRRSGTCSRGLLSQETLVLRTVDPIPRAACCFLGPFCHSSRRKGVRGGTHLGGVLGRPPFPRARPVGGGLSRRFGSSPRRDSRAPAEGRGARGHAHGGPLAPRDLHALGAGSPGERNMVVGVHLVCFRQYNI